jgi:hypothetical protein
MEPFEGNENQQLRKAFDNASSRNRIEMDLLTNKAVTRLTDLARGITIEEIQAEAADEDPLKNSPEAASEAEAPIPDEITPSMSEVEDETEKE